MIMLKSIALPRMLRYLIVSLVLLVPRQTIAQDEVESLGRLFIDAEQREKLEAVRRGTYKSETEQESRVSNVRVDGLMVRSDGENVIWINGNSTLDGPAVEGVKVDPDAADNESYSVRVSIDGKLVDIKPGQNWSEGTGTIKDNY